MINLMKLNAHKGRVYLMAVSTCNLLVHLLKTKWKRFLKH
jgi:hypothetical protein